MKILLFGTFDGLHPGHENLFEQAKELADELHVVIARDQTVKEVKGRMPKESENERKRAVEKHPLVTKAYLGNPGDKYRIIEEIHPDIIALGYDQQTFTQNLEKELSSRKLFPQIVRLKAFFPDKFKSSLVKI